MVLFVFRKCIIQMCRYLYFIKNVFNYMDAKLLFRGSVVEWLEHLAVVQKVAGLSPARAKDWKTLTVHPAENGYLIKFREG